MRTALYAILFLILVGCAFFVGRVTQPVEQVIETPKMACIPQDKFFEAVKEDNMQVLLFKDLGLEIKMLLISPKKSFVIVSWVKQAGMACIYDYTDEAEAARYSWNIFFPESEVET